MNLDDIGKLVQQKAAASDPELDKKFRAAMEHILVVPRAEHRRRGFAFYGVVGSLILFFLATGIIALLATLRLIEVEDKYLDRVWTSFIVETVSLGIWLVKQSFGKSD